jgi:hypothetical protein
MKKYLLCGTLALLLSGCGGGSSLTLNQDNFNRVHNGMSQVDVTAIMGQPTESKTDPIPIVGGTQTTYTYRNDKSEATIVFKNDQVTDSHANFGP